MPHSHRAAGWTPRLSGRAGGASGDGRVVGPHRAPRPGRCMGGTATVSDPFGALGAGDRVMVIAPHPDDEVIATGGVLALAASRGARVRVVYVTDGGHNPW